MANKFTDNPLLFSANVTSPFDNITSSAVLLPPTTISQELVEQNNKTTEKEPPHSLQPHLMSESKHSSSSLVNPSEPTPNISSLLQNQLPPVSTASVLAPPKGASGLSAGSLRRPTNKYAVPTKINSTPALCQLIPIVQPSVTPVAPFIPNTFIPKSELSHTINPCVTSNDPAAMPTSDSVLSNVPDTVHPPLTSRATESIIPASFDAMASNPPIQGQMYHPVIHHWFYAEGKPQVWKPFSFIDSINLEEAYRQGTDCISTDGGRYDVHVTQRTRSPVYWGAAGGPVMRCSWFRRTYAETFPVPFSEETSQKLEEEYKEALITGQWHRQVELPGGEIVMINSPVSLHFYQVQEPLPIQNIASITESQTPLTVRRGADDFEIKDGVSDRVDHLLFLIHGIGSICDLSFRSIEECVNDFRAMGDDLLATHFKDAIDSGKMGRVEILPISWHKALHGDATGLDSKLKKITLRSIPKFREFTNDTLLDILFYTSPVYCQHIMDTVASEMDRLYTLFCSRNPDYDGSVSVGGHSLGSVILFDLLMHQNPDASSKPSLSMNESSKTHYCDNLQEESADEHHSSLTSQVDFEIGVAGTGQPAIAYPQLSFQPQAIFLMGSPVGMFITVRGIDKLGPTFKLPTCDRVFNVFHPFDPVAYRIETLIDTSFSELRPVLIPHHKGRKRMHLELKDTIERVGSDIKNKIVDSIQATWNKFYQIYAGDLNQSQDMDEIRKLEPFALKEHMERLKVEAEAESRYTQEHVKIGELNRGLRVDYVLQEKPYESFTEYIFALQAHVSYWTSEDTLLMILKELYSIRGIYCDSNPTSQLHERRGSSFSSSVFPDSSHSFITSQPLKFSSSDEKLSEKTVPAPPDPVPLLSASSITSSVSQPNLLPVLSQPSTGTFARSQQPNQSSQMSQPRTLRGRPMVDPCTIASNQIGMDPTASPSSETVSPPPLVPNICFNHRRTNN